MKSGYPPIVVTCSDGVTAAAPIQEIARRDAMPVRIQPQEHLTDIRKHERTNNILIAVGRHTDILDRHDACSRRVLMLIEVDS